MPHQPHQKSLPDFSYQINYITQVRTLLTQRYEHQPLAHVHSFGCQQNVSDSEKLKGMLAQMGYGFTDSIHNADFVLYNTCAVRENAEAKVFGIVGELKHCKTRDPQMITALCGCMMQEQHVVSRLQKSYPYIDLIFGTHVAHLLPKLLYEVLRDHRRVIETSELRDELVEGVPIKREGTVKAWLPIMNGCDNFCSYCIVPYVRGREKSRRPEHILAEAKQLISEGYKEITLLGQNVNSYGKGLSEKTSFPKLLRELNALEGDFWIRFMTSHPKDCTHELINTIAACEKVCHHIHLPVQCGSSRILKKMNRSYTREDYIALIEYAKQKISDISFTSDIIVGFPGETYEDFTQTLDLIKEIRYTFLYTFLYSPRKGTKAAQLPDPISTAEKSKWFRELLDVQQEIGGKNYESMVGSTVTVLAEGTGKTGEEYITGRTAGNVIVDFKAPKEQIGSFVQVNITKALKWAVLGEINL